MLSLQQIQDQIKVFPSSSALGTKKEISSLPEILKDDEVIRGLTSGAQGGNTWLIVCTNKRVILLDKGMLFGLKKNEIPLDKINSVENSTGFIFGEIVIWHGASKIKITNVLKTTVNDFVNAVNEAVEEFKAGSKQVYSQSISQASELEKLMQLKEKGFISEEEFIAMKKKIISL